MNTYDDELDAHIAESMQDPEYARAHRLQTAAEEALEDALARYPLSATDLISRAVLDAVATLIAAQALRSAVDDMPEVRDMPQRWNPRFRIMAWLTERAKLLDSKGD